MTDNVKARTFIRKVASEQLTAALYGAIVTKALKRGFRAWSLGALEARDRENRLSVERFLHLRDLAAILGRSVHRAVDAKFGHWKKWVLAVRQRERDEKRYNAARTIQRVTRGVLTRVRTKVFM